MSRAGREHHYRLSRRSTYRYRSPVASSYLRTLLLPREGGGQRVHRCVLTVDPSPAEQEEHLDVYGNRVGYVHVATEHDVLEVSAFAVVTVTRRRPDPASLPSVSWEGAVAAVSAMRASGRGEQGEGPASVMTIVESALPSPMASPADAVLEYAVGSFPPGAPLVEAVFDLAGRIHTGMAALPGRATGDLTALLTTTRGTGQDLVHLLIASARALGLSARYVSGYMSHDGSGAAHSWAAVWVPGGGWLHVDPVRDALVDHRYILVGWGRDVLDVPPLRGVVFSSDGQPELQTTVDLTPLTSEQLAAET